MSRAIKIGILVAIAFIFGGATLTVLYATGTEVASEGPIMHMVSHSEYATGDNGQIIARLVDWKGDPITVDNCYATILYPNKTAYVSDGNMTAGGITGDHYYTFVAPAVEGVYEYQARCEYTVGTTKNASVTSSFQVVPAYNKIDIMEELVAYTATGIGQINLTVNNINSTLNVVSSQVTNMSADVQLIYALSTEINATTHSIYDYMTGTLATNINNVLSELGVINATVNRIESNTLDINSTVTAIKENQEVVVVMTTF